MKYYKGPVKVYLTNGDIIEGAYHNWNDDKTELELFSEDGIILCTISSDTIAMCYHKELPIINTQAFWAKA